jgi:hypothetical protein
VWPFVFAPGVIIGSQNNPSKTATFYAFARTKSGRGPCDPFSAFVRAKADRFRYSAAIAPNWDNGTTALAATLGVCLDTDLGHDSQVCLALTIGALAFARAAAQALAFEMPAAMSAGNLKAVSGLLHVVTPAVGDWRVTGVIPILTPQRAEIAIQVAARAFEDKRIAADEAWNDVVPRWRHRALG